MKAKHLSLAIAALIAAGGVWFLAFHKSSMGKMPRGQALAGGEDSNPSRPKPGQMLRPPDPNRKFWELTPEQRVQQARQPNGVGG